MELASLWSWLQLTRGAYVPHGCEASRLYVVNSFRGALIAAPLPHCHVYSPFCGELVFAHWFVGPVLANSVFFPIRKTSDAITFLVHLVALRAPFSSVAKLACRCFVCSAS